MPPLIALAIQEAPGLIAAFRELFHRQHPEEPSPSDEQIMAAFEAAYQSSRAKDDAWLAAHGG